MNSYMLKGVPDSTWEAIKAISERDYITIRGIIIKSLEQYIVVRGKDVLAAATNNSGVGHPVVGHPVVGDPGPGHPDYDGGRQPGDTF